MTIPPLAVTLAIVASVPFGSIAGAQTAPARPATPATATATSAAADVPVSLGVFEVSADKGALETTHSTCGHA